MAFPQYVLVTAAHNEEHYITKTLDSVVSQSLKPLRWIIVSDSSTDRTDEIVATYAAAHSFIRLLRLDAPHDRNFAAQVTAIHAGVAVVANISYDFIGNLDADVSFGPDYFRILLSRFDDNSALGIAGGCVRELGGTERRPCRGERMRSVAHAVQLFRSACFESIGGYRKLPYGGPDTFAEVAARMAGWEVEAFQDLVVQHHRVTGSANGIIRGRFRQGLMDFTLGYSPLFELAKCARRIHEPPIFIGSMVRLAAFWWAYLSIRERAVPEDFVSFLRAEQAERLRSYFQRSTAQLIPAADKFRARP